MEVDGMRVNMAWVRLFKFAEITKPNSPNGYLPKVLKCYRSRNFFLCSLGLKGIQYQLFFLPKFRFWMMDPNGMGLLSYERPASDGASRELQDQGRMKRSQNVT